MIDLLGDGIDQYGVYRIRLDMAYEWKVNYPKQAAEKLSEWNHICRTEWEKTGNVTTPDFLTWLREQIIKGELK